MICPKCESDQLKKNGKQKGYQVYLCKSCRHQWLPDKPKTEYELKESNSYNLEYVANAYKKVFLKLRKDTYGDLIERLDAYSQAHPDKGSLQKKILEILDEAFPRVEASEG